MSSETRKIQRARARKAYNEYRQGYYEIQERARAMGDELQAPLLPKSKALRKELINDAAQGDD